jgi:hypothetical protein
LHKFVYFFLIGAFLVTELRAIRKDRDDSESQALSARRAQDEAFQGIRATQDADFKATAGELKTSIDALGKLLGTTQDVAKLSKENLEDVTGGDRVVALEIVQNLTQNDVGTAFVFAPKRGIVRNVTVRVVNLALFDQDIQKKMPFAHDINFYVGDIGPGEGKNLSPPIQLGPGNFIRFNIFFSGLNGMWTENLYLRKKNGYWVEAFRVFRKCTKLTSQSDQDVVYKQIGKGYLERAKKWTGILCRSEL